MGGTAGVPFVDPDPTSQLGPVGMGDTTPAPSTPSTPAPTTTAPAGTQTAPGSQTNSDAAAASSQPDDTVTVTPDGQVTRPNIMERAYHGILSALGGSNDVQLSRDPQTGKMVATQVAKTPGAQWKQIISGALTGIAAGAGQVGPGRNGRALAGGITAGMQQQQQQQKARVDAANQDYDEQQKALVRKAQLQQMAVQTAAASFSLERSKVQAQDLDAKALNDHMAWIKDNGGTDVGTFKDFAAVSQYAKNDPGLAADIAHGRVAVLPNVVDGKVQGIDVARVPEGWGDQYNDKDLPIERQVPGKDGEPPKWVTETIPAGTIKNNDYNAAVLATVNQKAKQQADVVENEYKKAQTRLANSEAGKAQAETRALNNPANDDEIQANAQQLVNGTMDPANLSKRSKTYDATLAAANKISLETTGQPFDAARAASDYKFASNTGTKNTLNFLNSLTGRDNKSGNLGTVVSMSQRLGQTKFPALNDVEQWSKLSAGNPEVAAYRAALTETSDQIAKILQGGGTGSGTSDAKLKQAGELLNKNFNAGQMKATADTLRTLLANRKAETIGDNRYLQHWYGQPQGVTVTDPTGGVHVFPDQASAQKFKQAAGIK